MAASVTLCQEKPDLEGEAWKLGMGAHGSQRDPVSGKAIDKHSTGARPVLRPPGKLGVN